MTKVAALVWLVFVALFLAANLSAPMAPAGRPSLMETHRVK